MIQVYLASGWFNETQKRLMEEIYDILRVFERKNSIRIFAPFWNGIVLKPTDPREKWKEVFDLNVNKISDSHLMIASIEGFDPGTIFEMGVAYAHKVPVIAYSSVEGRSLNLMLAQSCIGFANTRDELELYTRTIISNPDIKILSRWEGEPE